MDLVPLICVSMARPKDVGAEPLGGSEGRQGRAPRGPQPPHGGPEPRTKFLTKIFLPSIYIIGGSWFPPSRGPGCARGKRSTSAERELGSLFASATALPPSATSLDPRPPLAPAFAHRLRPPPSATVLDHRPPAVRIGLGSLVQPQPVRSLCRMNGS